MSGANRPSFRWRELLVRTTHSLSPSSLSASAGARTSTPSSASGEKRSPSGDPSPHVDPYSAPQPVADSRSGQEDVEPSHDAPLPRGEKNRNPRGLGLWSLLAEDLRTHDGHWSEPGFLAVALHRFGNARMDVRPRVLRAPLTLAYRTLSTTVNWIWGIDLPYTVRLGRRVRLWHHGGMVLGARAIGDDVHIRHNTTFGVLNRNALTGKPIIGDRVDLGVGVGVFGAVTIGADAVIGPHSVVLHDLPPAAVVLGVPARSAALRRVPA
jgi:serine O-acetyltransferase